MPGNDSVGVTSLNASHHFVEVRTPLGHRALSLLIACNDIKVITSNKFPNFSELILDASDLTIFASGRFANVNDIALFCLIFHVASIAKSSRSAKKICVNKIFIFRLYKIHLIKDEAIFCEDISLLSFERL